MQRNIRSLIEEYNKRFADHHRANIREEIYRDDIQQLFEIAIEDSNYRENGKVNNLIFYAIVRSWEAGVITGAKRRK